MSNSLHTPLLVPALPPFIHLQLPTLLTTALIETVELLRNAILLTSSSLLVKLRRENPAFTSSSLNPVGRLGNAATPRDSAALPKPAVFVLLCAISSSRLRSMRMILESGRQ